MSKGRKVFLFVVALAFSYLVEWSASAFTSSSVSSWYLELAKPAWNPPSYVFPIVWTLLYTMIGLSFGLILCEKSAYTPRVFAAFFVQMFFNFTWSFVFFYLQIPLLGLLNIVFLATAILLNIFAFYPHSKWAGRLLIPYFLWVIYALTLNWGIWVMN